MKIAVHPSDAGKSRRPAEHSSFQRFSFQHFSFNLIPLIPLFPRNPLFPPSGLATGSLNGLHPKSKLLAANMLQVAVVNSGCWVPPSSGDSVGSGLANLRRRLFLLLGDAATLEVLDEPQAVVVMIRIPILSQAQADLLDSA